ncbi:hypothetical protein Tco_1159174 [Tanacetum coccineum]
MWSLWNPVSSKIIRFPPLILKDGESAFVKECCLSLLPEDPKSILLLTRTDKPTFVFCQLDRKRKRSRWIEMSYDKQLKRLSGDGCLLHSLSCYNGKIYGVSQENCIMPLVIEIDIVVKAGEAVIDIMLNAACPLSLNHYGYDYMYFLRGSDTELFCIIIAFHYCVETYDTTFSCVTLHKLDMSCINWDITGIEPEGLEQEDANKLYRSSELWEEMEDLKFYGEYGLVFYNPFTNAVRDLPDVVGISFYWLCFSAPPTSPDCHGMLIGKEGIFIHFVGGEKSWRLVSLDYDDDDDYRYHFYFPTLYDQDLYALCDDGELHIFKILAQEDCSWEQDAICEVFKLNDLKNEWEKTNGIGRHMIYISDSGVLVTDTDSITLSLPNKLEESFEDFVGTKHYPFSPQAWIEPSWS